MIIRDAQADDIEVLAAIAAEVYRSVFAPLLPEADLSVFGHAHFADRFAACLPRVRVIAGGDRPAGLCLLTEGNIDILFVAGARRNAGAGAALLRDAESRGARTLECFAANRAAIRFYQREGWTITAAYERSFAGAPHSFVRFARPPLS